MKAWMVFLALAGSAAGQADFRKAVWGMTRAQVRATEPTRPVEISETKGEIILRYGSLRMASLDCQPIYIFAKDRLVRAKYLFEAEHADLNDFIRDFKTVEPILIEELGKPSVERAIWEDDSTQLEPKSYLDQDRASPANILPSDPLVGLAVSLGHLRLYVQWDGARSSVAHVLTGHDHQVTHQIEYRSATLTPKSHK